MVRFNWRNIRCRVGYDWTPASFFSLPTHLNVSGVILTFDNILKKKLILKKIECPKKSLVINIITFNNKDDKLMTENE